MSVIFTISDENMVYPFNIKGKIYIDDVYNGDFKFDRDEQFNDYHFFIYRNDIKWHFRNMDGYPRVYSRNDAPKMFKWVADQGLELFYSIDSVIEKKQRNEYELANGPTEPPKLPIYFGATVSVDGVEGIVHEIRNGMVHVKFGKSMAWYPLHELQKGK